MNGGTDIQVRLGINLMKCRTDALKNQCKHTVRSGWGTRAGVPFLIERLMQFGGLRPCKTSVA